MLFPAECIPVEKWFAYKGDFPPCGKTHRMIITYHIDNTIKYFYVTSYESNEERHRIDLANKKDISSVAELNVIDWDSLTKVSCVQCNRSHISDITVEELQKQYALGKAEYIGPVPEIVKRKLIEATCSSSTFTDDEKKLYTT